MLFFFQPIEIRSDTYERTVHENNDLGFTVFVITTYDYNDPNQDSVTCEMSFTPYEENLFELRNTGYTYNCKYPVIWHDVLCGFTDKHLRSLPVLITATPE